MNILIVGSGGREHTLAWKLDQSPAVDRLFCAPGNAGISSIAECVNIPSHDIEALADWASNQEIDLTIVGPEAPLVDGIVDHFEERGLSIFGPRQDAARIEGSKVFANELMKKYDIPTAEYRTFTDPEQAREFVDQIGTPLVIKAEGLAAGKGVTVAMDREQAMEGIENTMVNKKFGDAGNRIVIEEYLEGEEVSILGLTDGETIVPLATSQDHKAINEGGTGPNTGGMGAYSPAPMVSDELFQEIQDDILHPAIDGLRNEGCPYTGVLYAGLMLTDDGPKVLEFNARFGDPEAQVILSRMENDLVDVLQAVQNRELEQLEMQWTNDVAVCVILASGGYPIEYEKGKRITGPDSVENREDITVFHAGTAYDDDQNLITDGGRVLGVNALGDTYETAIQKAYDAVEEIHFDDQYFRTDIGQQAIH